MTASWTARQFDSHACGIKLITSNAVKSRAAAFSFERTMIPPIVPQPERQKDDRDEQTVDDGSYRKVEHRNA
jgi:hypothetical protein